MRKAQRKMTKLTEIEAILRDGDVCHIGLADHDQPYVVPLNYGYEWDGRQLILYFHCANEGRKLDIIRCNNRACFQMDLRHQLIRGDQACRYTMNYESLIGTGCLEILTDQDERIHGLKVLMRHYSQRDDWDFDPHATAQTTVLRLRADEFCGKRLMKG